MGIFDKLFGESDKVLKYIRMLDAQFSDGRADWKKREEAAKKLGELGDKRAVKPLLEYAKRSHNPAAVEALGSIGGEEAAHALKELYWIDQYHKNNRPWLTYIEQALIKLEDYESCKKIMLLGSPNWSHDAARVVMKNPKWRKDKAVIREFISKFWSPPIITEQELLKEIDPDIRRDKQIILGLVKMHPLHSNGEINPSAESLIQDLKKYVSLDEIIVAVENGIEQINRDQEYYLREQTFGAPENYDWDEARKPLYEWLKYLKMAKV